MLIPVLFRPRILGVKNAYRALLRAKARPGREVGIVFFSAILLLLVYRGAAGVCENFRTTTELATLDPALPLSLFLNFLSGMILLSSCAAALGSFYLAHDLEMILSKPVTPARLFIGRSADTISQSVWMVMVFIAPTLAAIGGAYDAEGWYYLLAAVAVIPYLIIPCLLGIIAISLLVRILPAQRTREILFFTVAAIVLGAYIGLRGLMPENQDGASPEQLNHLLHVLKAGRTAWLPATWAADVIAWPLRGDFDSQRLGSALALLYGTCTVLSFVAYAILRLCYFESFSDTHSRARKLRIKSSKAQQRLQRFVPFLAAQARALWAKEMKLFARDVTQTVQMLLLLGICLVYVYNFKVVNRVDHLPFEAQLWWKGALTVCNTGMGAFVMTAVSTRFVFASVSLEGNSFWILQSAPISTMDILRIKFWSWFIPLGAISSVVLGSGAMAIDAEPHIVAITALASWILSYGIVGLAVGQGALFANFQWESVGQISASFGSLVFMIAGTILVVLDIIPVSILVICRVLRESGAPFSALQWYLCVGSTTFLLVYLNYMAARWSLKIGEQALLQRMAN